MKQTFKKLITAILAAQVRRLRKKRQFKVVAVAGGIGKTSTKFAVAQMLSQKYRVGWQKGNYNVDVTVPLVFFNLPLPSLANPFAWAVTLLKIEWRLLRPYPYDVVVVELGTDGPGQMAKFARFLRVDVAIVTAIVPEHMEFFAGIDAVAKEEMSISDFSEQVLVNKDLCDARYMPTRSKLLTYGINTEADYRVAAANLTANGYEVVIVKQGAELLQTTHPSISTAQIYSLSAAVAVADMLGLTADEIGQGLVNITPVPGRMQLLEGVNGAKIIDETYNASPEAVKAALQTLYAMPAPQKIALLGNMNELGNYSPAAHAEVGALCDPQQLEVVVTVGPDANAHLAPAAQKRGCQVQSFDSPYKAGEYIRSILKPGAVVLLKGSQNKVFAEEAIKSLLADPADTARLVRQSKHWLRIKQKQFGGPAT